MPDSLATGATLDPMTGGKGDTRRGILRADAGLKHFRVERVAVAPDLAPYAEHHWVLSWDLRGREPHRQQVLTHPYVHMTFTTGGRARVVGVVRGVFTETIGEAGRVVGVRFLPGGFRPFLGAPVSTITDRYVPVQEVFGPPARAAADAIIAAAATDEAIALMEDLLRSRAPAEPDPAIAEIGEIVRLIAADPALRRVDEVSAAAGVTPRSLQRRFADYVGVGPKWVICRYRMHEAAERAAAGTEIDWALLAAELGYADQAHFTRDFTATIGTSPARYAREARTS